MAIDVADPDLNRLAIAHGLESAEGELVECALSNSSVLHHVQVSTLADTSAPSALRPMFVGDERLARIKFGLLV